MTVSELIAKLQEMPQDAVMVTVDMEHDGSYISIDTVEARALVRNRHFGNAGNYLGDYLSAAIGETGAQPVACVVVY